MGEDKTANQDGRSFEERVFARFDAMDGRFNHIDVRFENIEARFENVDGRFNKLENRLNDIDTRLTTLEDTVDRRLKETRPIWEQVLEKLSQVDDSLRRVNSKFEVFANEMIELRADQSWLGKRIDKLEAERVKS